MVKARQKSRGKSARKSTTEKFDHTNYQLRKGCALILRTCNKDMTAYGGFVWPKSGSVEALDWKPTKKCGKGLHGLAKGEGNAELLSWDEYSVWVVAEVKEDELIYLDGKVKFPRANVIYSGDLKTASDLIVRCHPGSACAGLFSTAGSYGTATAGNRGTATAGDRGTATAGDRGTATAGNRGTATAGSYGTATAGDSGTATAGDYGTATAGHYGTATAGDYGTIIISRFDVVRTRLVVGYIGENDLVANTPYKLDSSGNFVKADV